MFPTGLTGYVASPARPPRPGLDLAPDLVLGLALCEVFVFSTPPAKRCASEDGAWRRVVGAVVFIRSLRKNILADPQLEPSGIGALLRRAAAGEAVHLPLIRVQPEPDVSRQQPAR